MIRVLDGRKFDFTLIENDLIDDIERFDKNDLLCYMVLCRYANNSTGECYPSYKTIAEKMRVGISTAIKAIKSLESKGVIKIHSRKNENGGDTSNLYVIQNINDENKKASTVPPVKANNKNIKDNNIIHKNKKMYTQKNKKNENKVLHNKHNDSVNNNFTNYEEKELESMLREKQKEKFGDVQSFEFNPNFKI